MKFLIECGDHADEFVIPEGSTVIGAARGCRMMVDLPGVAPRHAQCYFDGNQHVTIKPLSSDHPVIVNGQEVERADLHSYDEIRLGEAKLTFIMETAKEPEPGEDLPAGAGATSGVTFEEAPDDSTFEERPESMSLATVEKPGQSLPETTEGRPTELIHRDGRWILRDLLTGREVEVTPHEAEEIEARKAAAASDEVEARPLPSEKSVARTAKSRRVLLAIGAIVVVGLAVWLLVRPEARPPERKLEDYERSLRMGFASLAQDDLERATAHLEKSTKLVPESKLARILLDLAQLESERGESYRSYRWGAAESLYQELKRHPDASGEMQQLAHARIVLVTSFRVHESMLKEAEELAALGRPAEAYAKALRIPGDSVLREQSGSRLKKIRVAAVSDLLNKARVARQEGRWDRAVRYASDAVKVDPDSAPAEKELSLCRKVRSAEMALATAQGLLEASRELEGSPIEAVQLLRKALAEIRHEGQRPLYEGTPLESKGQSLLKNIEETIASLEDAKVTSAVAELFTQGNGKAALEMIERNQDALPAGALAMRPTIEAAIRLLSAATQLDEKRQYVEARESWRRLAEKVTDPENEYHRQAKVRLQWYQENTGAIAEEYRKWALSLLGDNPLKAREFLNGALQWDPQNEEASKALKELDKQAELHFRLGFAIRNREGEKAKARQHFLNVLDYAEENSDLAIKARQELKKLEP